MTPDEICRAFDDADTAAGGGVSHLLWEVIEDVQSSYLWALENIPPEVWNEGLDALIEYVVVTVNDYLANHYGED